MNTIIVVSMLFLTQESCLFLPAGLNPGAVAVSGRRIYGITGEGASIPGFQVVTLPGAPLAKGGTDAALEAVWRSLPDAATLWVSARREVLLVRNGRLLRYHKGLWVNQLAETILMSAGVSGHLVFISGRYLGVWSRGRVTLRPLPTGDAVRSVATDDRGRIALLTGSGVYLGTGRPGGGFSFYENHGGHRVLFAEGKCLVLGPREVRRCTGSRFRSGYYEDGWDVGGRLWLKAPDGLWIKLRGRLRRCDTGLVPKEVRRVFPGGIVQADGLYYPVVRRGPVPAPVWRAGAVRVTCQRMEGAEAGPGEEVTVGLGTTLLPQVSLSVQAAGRSTPGTALERTASIFLHLEWRPFGQDLAAMASEVRLARRDRERRGQRRLARCHAAHRLLIHGRSVEDPALSRLVQLRVAELSGGGRGGAAMTIFFLFALLSLPPDSATPAPRRAAPQSPEELCRRYQLRSPYCRPKVTVPPFVRIARAAREAFREGYGTTRRLATRIRRAALLPTISLEYGRWDDMDVSWSAKPGESLYQDEVVGLRQFFRVKVTWDARPLLFDPNDIILLREKRKAALLWESHEERVRRMYFKWKRELLLFRRRPTLGRLLSLEELEASLDALTRAAFSRFRRGSD